MTKKIDINKKFANFKENFLASLIHSLSFIILLTIYLLNRLALFIFNLPLLSKIFTNNFKKSYHSIYKKIASVFDRGVGRSISRLELIDLSIKNMTVKKTRTTITVGGMAIGIGSIVFLVSIGYGLQTLVVSRVARLEEMNQANVTIQPGSKLTINNVVVDKFKAFDSIDEVLPMISVVGKVKYKEAATDMPVYGVTTSYLEKSSIKPARGQLFDSEEIRGEVDSEVDSESEEEKEQVKGVSTMRIKNRQSEVGQVIKEANFSINPGTWLKVRSTPSMDSEIIGYTKRTADTQNGTEVWGELYPFAEENDQFVVNPNGDKFAKWIWAEVDIWTKTKDGYVPVNKEKDEQQALTGYIAEVGMTVQGYKIDRSSVLGVSDDNQQVSESDIKTREDGWVEIASISGQRAESKYKQVEPQLETVNQAVVNRAMLDVLGLEENEAVGQKIEVVFTVTDELLSDFDTKVSSVPMDYEIVGVIPGEGTPHFYVPFIDLRALGIDRYSQTKIVAGSKELLKPARLKIEALGYNTQSVADTVDQINSLFSTARLALAFVGMIALSVAALGMFNTLTVSLLERTREVGLMKALGMKSNEVKELFLTESMIMSFLGGVLGILGGVTMGKLLGLGLSAISLTKGLGMINVSTVPLVFTLIIIGLSLLVGIVTGFYPAKRATKISALNALRYE